MFVEFIIPTFDRVNALKSMLSSLVAQSDRDWSAHVLIDSPGDTVMQGVVDGFLDNRIYSTVMDKRYNDWGHSLREIGKQTSEADYVILTCDDNYYMPNVVAELRQNSIARPGIVYWDMVHSHYSYHYFKCSPAYNQIDMGSFATRTDMAKQVKMNTTYAADGEFIDDVKKAFPNEKIVRIDKVMFVHN